MGNKKTPWTAADIPDLRGRTAIVTGASAGLGLETALRLAERGAKVVLACRNVEKAAAAADVIRASVPEAELPIVRVDLSSLASVREAADQVRAEYERIDLLINNAGTLNRERSETVDGFETTFATNHLGPFAFTGLLLDRLLAAGSARVVTVSSASSGHGSTVLDLDDLGYEKRAYKGMRVYGQSKLANLLFTFELQRQLNGTAAELVALAAHPGAAHSDFVENLSPAIRMLKHPTINWATSWMLQSTEMGALPTLRAAADPSARGGEFYGPTGKIHGYPVLVEASAEANDPDLAGKLWVESERLTGVTYDFG
ncbi:SDR family NAD(P)-dependent oxidoreductase [Nocardia sp. SYP-A9097]|uniref:oxidoreductase n=1 Tax=Nocardia sp. SYP-A9097 TaxID=2663237 RepID=UPI00132A75AC|nr:oxidoreductase [Nocardia sp. SYP-A9097]MRH90278.1 SDR family NAD(P)-dependent oxidoreductase [Nocardia sp. SYP-A9097]